MVDEAPRQGASHLVTLKGASPRVVLVNMPFAGYRQPSLALGILKAALRPVSSQISVLDANLTFAEMISPLLYDKISTWPAQDLLGDWVFSNSSGPREGQYEARVLAGGAAEHRIAHFGKPPVTAQLRAELLEARRKVDDLLESCLEEITRFDPDVVGFTAMFHQLSAALGLARRVKTARPETLVVMGGASCRGEMGEELLASFPFLDEVVDGEGERTLPEIVQRHRGDLGGSEAKEPGTDMAKSNRKRFSRGEAMCADLNGLPYPDYDDYFARLARSPLLGTFAPRIPFESSRGCWWGEKRRCAFCAQASKELTYRQKDAERAIQELEYLTGRHPGCPVFFSDEIVPGNAFEVFIPELASRVPELEVVYLELRPSLKKDQLLLLAEAGIRRLEVGIESLSSPVLRLMRKGTTALQGVQFLKQARELGLEVVWNLLWGLPGEDPSEYAQMAGIVPLLSHLQPPNTVGSFRLERFSPIFEEPDAFGIVDRRPYPSYGYVYDLPAASLGRLAYFFSFGYGQVQAVESYTRDLADEIVAWKEGFPESMLSYCDDGEQLVVRDERPGIATGELTVLTGLHRTVFRACDEVITKARLAALVDEAQHASVTGQELDEALAALVEERLVLRDGHRYLSLAIFRP